MKTFLVIITLRAFPFFLQASTVVEVRAGREMINAIEGILVLPPSLVVERIITGNSAVLMWIQPPYWNPEDHTISFAGFSPGGFSRTVPLFTIEHSSGSVTYAGGRLFGYRNDGEGTKIVLEYAFAPDVPEEDLAPPEPFQPIISSSPDLFEGRYFVSFSTQDKGTGVDHYEYASSWILPPSKGAWQEVESPLELHNANLFKKVYIRALDGAGNVRVSSITSPYRYATWAFGIIIMVWVFFFVRRSFR